MNEDGIQAEELALDLIPAVDQQIESKDTKFVGVTYQRLTGEESLPSDDAKKMIALCLADEVEAMNAESRPFSLSRYETMLNFLPVLPE